MKRAELCYDALPFLHGATHVTIAALCEAGDEDIAARQVNDVADYLARHGISGDPRVIPDRDGSAAEQLTNLAQQGGRGFARGGGVRTQPPGRMVLRWRNPGSARGKSNLLSDVTLGTPKRQERWI